MLYLTFTPPLPHSLQLKLLGSTTTCTPPTKCGTIPRSHIISSFNATHHFYADDTQIYLALDSRNFGSSIAELAECLACIQKWMDGVKLKFNPEKTEFTVIGDRQARESLLQKFPTQFLENSISPTSEVLLRYNSLPCGTEC